MGTGKDWIKVQWNLLPKSVPVTYHKLKIEASNYETQAPNGQFKEYKVPNVYYGDSTNKIQRTIRDLSSGLIYYVSVLTFYEQGNYIQSDVKMVSTLTNPPGRLSFSENTDTSFRVKWSHPVEGKSPQGYFIRWKQYGMEWEDLGLEKFLSGKQTEMLLENLDPDLYYVVEIRATYPGGITSLPSSV